MYSSSRAAPRIATSSASAEQRDALGRAVVPRHRRRGRATPHLRHLPRGAQVDQHPRRHVAVEQHVLAAQVPVHDVARAQDRDARYDADRDVERFVSL